MVNSHSKFFIITIALLAALPPFATDTYLPAMSVMGDYFHVDPSKLLITMTMYFIGFTIGVIIWGPLLDRVGRKPILYTGMILYIISTLLSTQAMNLPFLCMTRTLQSIGDSAAITSAFAIARDTHSGKQLIKLTSTLAMIAMIAPAISPIIGTLLLFNHHWQNIFYFLAAYGIIVSIASYFLPETLDKTKQSTSIKASIAQYGSHLANKRFMIQSIALAILFGAFFSFLCSASIVYMHIYNLSKLTFSGLFALNATAIILASATLKWLCSHYKTLNIEIAGGIIGCIGVLLALWLTWRYPTAFWVFTISMYISTFGCSLSVNALRGDAPNSVSMGFGTATSVITVIRNIVASAVSLTMSHWLTTSTLPLNLQQLVLIIIGMILLGWLLKIRSTQTR